MTPEQNLVLASCFGLLLMGLKKRSARLTNGPSLPSDPDLLQQCATCLKWLAAETFTRKQLRKGTKHRCSACVTQSHVKNGNSAKQGAVNGAKKRATRRGTSRACANTNTAVAMSFEVKQLLLLVQDKANLLALTTWVLDHREWAQDRRERKPGNAQQKQHRGQQQQPPRAWKQLMLATLLPGWREAVLDFVEAQTHVHGIAGGLYCSCIITHCH
jgi:hypothetical protein